jgi:hypothetical protein
MTLSDLFNIKEELLKELQEEISSMPFKSADEKEKYYEIASMSIMKFYVHSMITIIDEPAKNKAA